jgi:hypothetical protein
MKDAKKTLMHSNSFLNGTYLLKYSDKNLKKAESILFRANASHIE